MKQIMTIVALLFALCAGAQGRAGKATQTGNSMKDKKVLVAFFSHTGENYGVGIISKGNTHIIAEMIAKATGGTLFEIQPVKEYPKTYQACVEVAKQEKEASERPAIKGDIAVEEYDTVFIGYPNWWSDIPMPVYTFIGKHQWQGKTVIPFCTHEGSGLSDTEQYIATACKGATVKKGLAVRGTTAQKQPDKAQASVLNWLKGL